MLIRSQGRSWTPRRLAIANTRLLASLRQSSSGDPHHQAPAADASKTAHTARDISNPVIIYAATLAISHAQKKRRNAKIADDKEQER